VTSGQETTDWEAAVAPEPTHSDREIARKRVMAPSDEEVGAAVQKVWEYHHLHHALPPSADGVMCLCSSDLGVAEHAAKTFLSGRCVQQHAVPAECNSTYLPWSD
jgi:hypothetical protein